MYQNIYICMYLCMPLFIFNKAGWKYTLIAILLSILFYNIYIYIAIYFVTYNYTLVQLSILQLIASNTIVASYVYIEAIASMRPEVEV
jgi:hypothetical protein